jgi:hypothetical protein
MRMCRGERDEEEKERRQNGIFPSALLHQITFFRLLFVRARETKLIKRPSDDDDDDDHIPKMPAHFVMAGRIEL